MISNVKVLERERDVATSERPDRAEVEDAFRTIIRWTGDDPKRDGLIENDYANTNIHTVSRESAAL